MKNTRRHHVWKEQAGYWWDNYSVRDSAKLKDEEASYLESLGFIWEPHRAKEHPDEPGAEPRLAMMMKAEVKGNSGAKSKDDMVERLNVVNG